ncbi:MAG TPA: polysaccharide biosynthesis/export family protein [Pyrinomonadaceae bacterium]|nr:polysaccharide biosynthesis/export family protein [Pyrinomonadaceae bacterium]
MYRTLILVILISGSSALTTAQDSQAERLVREGVEFTGAGQFAQAIRAFEEAIKLEPDSGEAYAALGRAYFKMREWRRAAAYLRRATALNAQQKHAKNSLPVSEVAVVEPVRQTAQPAPTPHTAMSAASFYPQKIPAPATTAIQISSSLALELTAPEVTQPAPESVVQSEAPSAPEEKQEPIGTNVSMNVSPTMIGESGPVSPIPLNVPSEDVSLTKVYRVGPGDVLDIRINEAQPQQSTLFTVTPAGLLEHPLLAEPLSVSALTTEEIQTKIQDDLKTRALIENPAVSVGVRDYASHAILVSGLVKDSGTRFLRREAIPLYVVVADAQPLPEAAKVTVMRNEQNQVFEIELTNMAHMNLLVRTGDVISLHPNETQFIYVGGEVKAPGEKIFRRGLTLMQAIISAGGMTSKSKVAEVSRDDGRGFLVKTSVTLKDIQTGKVMDPLIKAGDRITILR